MKQIRVMLVDDSAVVRQVLQAVLEQEPDIRVIATASDPLFAQEKLKKEWPDVIVLDVEMPRMDGITFLTKIMAEHPTPVVICSTLTEKGSETALQALSSGAVCVVTKPKVGLKQFLHDCSDDLISAVKAAARSNVRRLVPSAPAPSAVAPKAHLASNVVHWGPYYIKAVREVLDGTWKGNQRSIWGAPEGTTEVIKINAAVPEAVRKKAEEAAAGLKAGTLSPFTGPLADNSGKERLAKGVVADQDWLDKVDFYVKGVEGKVPSGK